MKSLTVRISTNSIMHRALICLSLLLCFVAVPLAAQTAAKPSVNAAAPQISELNAATLQANGLPGIYVWHYGTVLGIGDFSPAGGREVVIQWDQGGGSRKQGGITDAEWEILERAFSGSSGRIAVLSDFVTGWQFDYRFLEAQR
jgi:hypothetical protein